jgi:hypothetical protein
MARTVLEHDERSDTVFFLLCHFFNEKKKILNLKPLKLKDSTQGHVCGLPQHHGIRQN